MPFSRKQNGTIKKKEINTPATSVYNQSNANTIDVDRSERHRIFDITHILTLPTTSSSRNWAECENVDGEINEIVQWSIHWLMEQNNTDISPPIAGTNNLIQIPNIFRSHQEYVYVMKPLVYLELWQFIYQTLSTGEDLGYELLLFFL